MPTDRIISTHSDEGSPERAAGDDDAAEIRYSLTALGEATLADGERSSSGSVFRGFGPCVAVA